MKLVKLFDCGKVAELEEKINDFLNTMESKDSFKIIDIKYNSYPWSENLHDYHSAMIFYEI